MKKRRKMSAVNLVLVPALFAVSGCSYDPNDEGGSQQRDVYTKFEDCVADWGKPELCQKIAEAEAKQFAQTTGVSHGGTSPIIFWGPLYYGGLDGGRSVMYNGQTYTPSANRAMSRPFNVTSTSSSFAKASPSTPARSASKASTGSAPRGGFGATGRAASVASSGG